jgi:hypothetical protein
MLEGSWDLAFFCEAEAKRSPQLTLGNSSHKLRRGVFSEFEPDSVLRHRVSRSVGGSFNATSKRKPRTAGRRQAGLHVGPGTQTQRNCLDPAHQRGQRVACSVLIRSDALASAGWSQRMFAASGAKTQRRWRALLPYSRFTAGSLRILELEPVPGPAGSVVGPETLGHNTRAERPGRPDNQGAR